ncbi:hypothetical protein ACTXT7_006987 [Hymenolepis weldensis]
MGVYILCTGRTVPNDTRVGIQIRMHHRRNLRSRHAALASKLKTDLTKIYLDPRPEITEFLRNHRPDRYSGCFIRPRKRIKFEPTSESLGQELSPGGVG